MRRKRSVMQAMRSAVAGTLLSGIRVLGYDVGRRTGATYDLHEGAVDRSGMAWWNQDAATMRRVFRNLVMNNDRAKGLVDALARKVVGRRGIWPQVQTADEGFNQALEREFRRWSKRADLSGRLSWGSAQRMALRESATVGEAFAYHGVDEVRRFFVEPFEAEQLGGVWPSMRLGEGEQYAGGIVYDRYGRALRYLVKRSSADGLGLGAALVEYDELPSRRVVHAFQANRPTDWRGVSRFAQTATTLFDIGEANRAELRGIKAASKIGLAIEANPETDPNRVLDGLGAAEVENEDGTITRQIDFGDQFVNVLPGKMSLLDANRPGNQHKPFIELNLFGIAAAWGMPYHVISGDNTKANYTQLRAALIEAKECYEDQQEFMVERWCEPLWVAFVTWAVLSGRVRLPLGMTLEDVLESTVWQRPGWPYVDLLKEIQAHVLEIESGLRTWSDIQREKGRDPREQLQAMAAERRLVEQVSAELGEELRIPTYGGSLAEKIIEEDAKARQREEQQQDQQDDEQLDDEMMTGARRRGTA